jgi:hypothetical protein
VKESAPCQPTEGGNVAGVEVKNVNTPDEVREFAGVGRGGVLSVGGHPVLYGTFEPGWKWSEHIKPIAGTDSCEAAHLLYCVSGHMHIVMDDGSEADIHPGDVASIEPGHDAWIVGDESFTAVDFGGYAQYGKPPEAD